MHTTLVERSSLTTSSVCILVGRYCALLHTSMHDTYSGVEYTQRGKHTQYIYYIYLLLVARSIWQVTDIATDAASPLSQTSP